MAVTTLLGLPIPQMSDSVGKTIPDLASAMQMIDEKLGGSRIVDHNLDVVDPENGWYWRAEDGRQVCRISGLEVEKGSNTNTQWSFPAAFFASTSYSVLVTVHWRESWAAAVPLIRRISGDYVRIWVYDAPGTVSTTSKGFKLDIAAIGKWK